MKHQPTKHFGKSNNPLYPENNLAESVVMDKWNGKPRRNSLRVPLWDYGGKGSYFVTIITKGRQNFFGKIQATGRPLCQKNVSVVLSEIGKIVDEEWLKTFAMRPDMNLSMGEYVIMPDHFHAILNVRANNKPEGGLQTGKAFENRPNNRFGPQRKNLASIIRGFKSGVSGRARQINPDFQWHPRFHDRIICDEQAVRDISRYIRANPLDWALKNPGKV